MRGGAAIPYHFYCETTFMEKLRTILESNNVAWSVQPSSFKAIVPELCKIHEYQNGMEDRSGVAGKRKHLIRGNPDRAICVLYVQVHVPNKVSSNLLNKAANTAANEDGE